MRWKKKKNSSWNGSCLGSESGNIIALFIQRHECNLNGRENDERTQVDTNTNKITPGLNGA